MSIQRSPADGLAVSFRSRVRCWSFVQQLDCNLADGVARRDERERTVLIPEGVPSDLIPDP